MMTSLDGSIKRVSRTPTITTRNVNEAVGAVSRKHSCMSVESAADLRHATISELRDTAIQVVEDIVEQSRILYADMEAKLPKFHPSEVQLGRVIGRGGFCVCQEIEKISPIKPSPPVIQPGTSSSSSPQVLMGLKSGKETVVDNVTTQNNNKKKNGFFLFRILHRRDTESSSTNDNDSSYSERSCDHIKNKNEENHDGINVSRDHVIKQVKATRTGRKCCYVVKSVSTTSSKITYLKGMVDIALEAKFLSSLRHRNIIDLVGLSATGPCSKSYFLILERMEETLSTRIKTWMDRERMTQGVFSCVGGSKRLEQLYIDRVEALYDIASALQYLHSLNIMYRDVKPDNIGFDRNNILKLFDLGLCKELKEQDKDSQGMYRNMTALTGAIRYMSPEVGTGKPYNTAADVYSWAMLMWFVLALEPPFGLYTEKMIMDRAWTRGYRPVVFRRWTKNIQDLIRAAWQQNPSDRPSFLDVTLSLKQELLNFDVTNTWGSTGTSDVSDPQM
jgi:serine/threonine protein kinase